MLRICPSFEVERKQGKNKRRRLCGLQVIVDRYFRVSRQLHAVNQQRENVGLNKYSEMVKVSDFLSFKILFGVVSCRYR